MNEFEEISKNLKDIGIIETLKNLNINEIKDSTLKIILRGTKYHHKKLVKYLEEEIIKHSKKSTKK